MLAPVPSAADISRVTVPSTSAAVIALPSRRKLTDRSPNAGDMLSAATTATSRAVLIVGFPFRTWILLQPRRAKYYPKKRQDIVTKGHLRVMPSVSVLDRH